MDERTELQIARGLKSRCPDAWRRLYDAYALRVWHGVARLMGSDSAAVADVVQETFLAAARSADRFDPRRGALWPWLWGIARRQVALQYRRQRGRGELVEARRWWASLDGAKGEWLAAEADAPDEVLESRELRELVRQALGCLPDEYQALLTIRYLDGAPVSEIAKELNRSSAAVRSKLARARRAFRRTFLRMTR